MKLVFPAQPRLGELNVRSWCDSYSEWTLKPASSDVTTYQIKSLDMEGTYTIDFDVFTILPSRVRCSYDHLSRTRTYYYNAMTPPQVRTTGPQRCLNLNLPPHQISK